LLKRHAAHELALGIVETRPDLPAYEQAVAAAGMRVTAVYPAMAYAMDEYNLRKWSAQLGVLRPQWGVQPIKSQLSSWQRYIGRRLQAMAKGIRISPIPDLDAWQQMAASVLLWAGGEMFLMVEKRP
jgi:hypothetical protein